MNKDSEFYKRALNRANEKLCRLMDSKDWNETDINEATAKIKALEDEKKEQETAKLLERHNESQDKKRAMLKRALSIQLPEEDITTQDSTIHGTKIKKHPELMKLQEDTWRLYLTFEKGMYPKIQVSGDTYNLLKYKSNGYGEDSTYEPFETFEEACKYNGIQFKNPTIKKSLQNIAKLQAESDKMKAKLEEYSERCKKLNSHTLSNIGAISQQQRHHYEYFH